jgi:hypothetical protein
LRKFDQEQKVDYKGADDDQSKDVSSDASAPANDTHVFPDNFSRICGFSLK